MRTLGLVSLGSALAVFAVAQNPEADVSRVIQGVITGVGFLGAGVILHLGRDGQIVQVSTAATIWITASLGILCGLAAWQLLAVAFFLTLFLLSRAAQSRIGGIGRASALTNPTSQRQRDEGN